MQHFFFTRLLSQQKKHRATESKMSRKMLGLDKYEEEKKRQAELGWSRNLGVGTKAAAAAAVTVIAAGAVAAAAAKFKLWE